MILESAILSPYFLRFNPALNAFEETPFHKALTALRDEIRRFNEANSSGNLSVIFEHSPKQRLNRNGIITVEPKKVALLLHLFDRWINIIELCMALYRYLDGMTFVEPSLHSKSPVEGMDERIDAESPTVDETIAFINFDHDAPHN